jgi:hypothetical protein
MGDFPTSADQLSADALTQYLREDGCLDEGHVVDFDYKMIGTGKMGDNARLSLRYSGDAAGAPATIIAKLPAADEHARAMAGAQGAYYNEVMFYRDLADKTAMRTPYIYGSELSSDRSAFLLLMEDMAPAEPGSALVGATRSQTEQALRQAAKLAASYYDDDSLAERDYIMTPARDDGGEFGGALMEQYWPGFVDRFGHGISADMVAFGERYVSGHRHFVNRFKGPKTLAHGDFRNENLLFGKSEATTVDWQTLGESSALTDAAYFLGGSVEPDDRRNWEKALISEYRVLLDREGVSLSDQACWDQYREFAMHAIVITVLGASFSSPDERGDKMFLAMIQRHLQHCIDVDAGEFLPN